ncbi:unnamed protein product [Discula destructiva]
MSSSSEPTLTPKALPSEAHEVIVVLETIHVPWEPVDLSPKTYEALVYHNTVADRDDVAARIKNASIVVCTICKLSAATLSQAPFLKCILTHAVGTDHIDLAFCRQQQRDGAGGSGSSIQVMNSRDCNSETVAEHALALYFATRRSLVPVHGALLTTAATAGAGAGEPNEWKASGSLNGRMRDGEGRPPRTCRGEVVGVIGHGAVGKHIVRLCTALGMRVLISDRKGPPSSSLQTTDTPPNARTPFPTLLTTASVLFLALPLTPTTHSLIAAPELARMDPHTVLINVSRGGIVDEPAVLRALRERRIFGYGTDVFATEPAGGAGDSCLLGEEGRGVNLVMTAHLAWLSETTVANQRGKVQANLRAWLEGRGGGDVVVMGNT